MQPLILNISSIDDARNLSDEIASGFIDSGLVVLRGASLDNLGHLEITADLGDRFGWSITSELLEEDRIASNDQIFFKGGESWDSKAIDRPEDFYVLPWHIEQVYYKEPILAGSWNMKHFTSASTSGRTLFVDSQEIYRSLTDEERELLDVSWVRWKKSEEEPTYYTKAVMPHPITGNPTIRLETDVWSWMPPVLHFAEGRGSQYDAVLYASIYSKLLDSLYHNESVRYPHEWEQGDIVIVDLFRMYHALMGGFSRDERLFAGIFPRPKGHTSDRFIEPKPWENQ